MSWRGISRAFLIAASVLCAARLRGESVEASASGRVEWAAGRLVLERSIPSAAFADPSARFAAQRQAEEDMERFFFRFAPSLVVDSWSDLGSLVSADRPDSAAWEPSSGGLLDALGRLALRGKLVASHMSEDLRTAHFAWSYPLFGDGGLVSLLVTHARPFPIPRAFGGAFTTRYSGLVIYAAEPVPSYGTGESRLPQPALFPRIYDEAMNLVLERRMCDPASLVRWGMVAYTDDPADPGPAERIGPKPLRVMARGVFGRNDTDLLISRESAQRLLASEDNRRLLREGRIMVVYRTTSSSLAPWAAAPVLPSGVSAPQPLR